MKIVKLGDLRNLDRIPDAKEPFNEFVNGIFDTLGDNEGSDYLNRAPEFRKTLKNIRKGRLHIGDAVSFLEQENLHRQGGNGMFQNHNFWPYGDKTELMKYSPQDIVFDQEEIMPYGRIGIRINWNKVFKDKIGISYPEAINWNKCINEKGQFDMDKFFLYRSGLEDKRTKYIETLENSLGRIGRMITRPELDGYGIVDLIKRVKDAFQEMWQLGDRDQKTDIYNKPFYTELEELMSRINENSMLPNYGFLPILQEIAQYITQAMEREKTERPVLVQKNMGYKLNVLQKYVDTDGFLNVDGILSALNGHATWNEEIMLAAFYTAKCRKSDLIKLQQGVIGALSSKVERLDTFKVFIMLQWVLPYVYNNFRIDWQLPEIFRPKYLSHISIYNLSVDGFTDQVRSKGEKLGWPAEIQDKLIAQFKEFGTGEKGHIGFGQGSEQLRYRNGVTGEVNEKNLKHYLVDEDLGLDKIPMPNILVGDDDTLRLGDNGGIKALNK